MSGERPPMPAAGEWEAAPSTLIWRVPARLKASDGKPATCRGGPTREICGRPAVASLLRGKRGLPYAYCELHLYGCWIEDGRVMNWRPVP